MKAFDAKAILPLVAGCLASAQIGKLPPALGAIREELAVGVVHAGWIATAINACAALLGVLVGLALAHTGAQRGLLYGLLLLCAGSAFGGLAPDSMLLTAARTVEGAGFVLVVIAAPSILATEAADNPARRRLLLSMWSCYMPIGMALTMAVAPPLLQQYGWRGLWGWNAAGLAACLLVALACVDRTGRTARPRPHPPATFSRARIAQPIPWLMGICFGCYAAIWFMVATWLPSFAVEHMGYTTRSATWLTALAVAGNVAGNLSTGYWLSKGFPRWSLMAGVLLMMGALGWFVFSAAYDPVPRSIAAIIACGAGGILPALTMGGIPLFARSPADIAVGNGILMQCSNVGTFLGVPAIAAVATMLGGWDGGRWLIPLLAGIGILAALALRGAETRRLAPDAEAATGILAEQT